MERVEGSTLRELLVAGPLSINQVIREFAERRDSGP